MLFCCMAVRFDKKEIGLTNCLIFPSTKNLPLVNICVLAQSYHSHKQPAKLWSSSASQMMTGSILKTTNLHP